jgi:hypothetical protein
VGELGGGRINDIRRGEWMGKVLDQRGGMRSGTQESTGRDQELWCREVKTREGWKDEGREGEGEMEQIR